MVQKKYVKSKDLYKTTFRLEEPAVVDADQVELVGDFNDWGKGKSLPMQQLKNGTYKLVVDLPEGEYAYKFLVDNDQWVTDTDADKLVQDNFGGQNSVVICQ